MPAGLDRDHPKKRRTHLSHPNALALDRCRWRIGTGVWRPAEEIASVDRRVREALSKSPAGTKRIPVEIEYEFDAKSLPAGELLLALAPPARIHIELNGKTVPARPDCGAWKGSALRLLRVDPAFVRLGDNRLHLRMACAETDRLEAIYLLGEFGVKKVART